MPKVKYHFPSTALPASLPQDLIYFSKDMTAHLKPYPSYKPSGVEWLGDVPAHWEVRRLKWVASLNPSRTEARTFLTADTPVTFLPMERVGTDGEIDEKMVSASDVWNGFTYFRQADVLVAKITPCFENGKGACLDALSTEIGFGSTEFHVLRAGSSISSQFLYRLTTLAPFRHSGAEAMTGAAGQQRVPQAFVANYPLPVPPLAEQAAIVRSDFAIMLTCTKTTALPRVCRLCEPRLRRTKWIAFD